MRALIRDLSPSLERCWRCLRALIAMLSQLKRGFSACLYARIAQMLARATRTQCLSVGLAFQPGFAAVLSTQIELHTLTALSVKCMKIDSKDACRRIYMWVFASRRLFACLVDVRVLTRLEASQGLLLATWAIALPFTQRKVSCMMFELQRGCPGVCTACQAL